MDSRRNASFGSRSELRTGIDVTPLVDICLVLLIIFMVIAPRLGNPIPVPETPNPRRLAADAERTTIALDFNGLVWIDRLLIPQERLSATLANLESSQPGRLVVVEADRSLPYRDVRRLVERLQAAGLPKVALAANRRAG